MAFLEPESPIRAEQLEDFDALILLAHRFDARACPASGRLAVVARFGVGYDTVDVDACTAAGIALVITPDGVRRPVAVSVMTLMLALTGKLMVKDRLTRAAAAGYARRSEHMGVGLVGRTLGSLGIGNIGAEVFRLARPFDMTFIAHDPFADPALAAELGVELVGLEELFRRADVLSVSCPLTPETHHLVNAERLALMKPTAYLINTARGPIVDQAALTAALQAGRIAGAGLDVLEHGAARTRTTRSWRSTTSSSRRTRSAGPTSASPATAPPTCGRCSTCSEGREPRGVVNREVLATDALAKRASRRLRPRFGTTADRTPRPAGDKRPDNREGGLPTMNDRERRDFEAGLAAEVDACLRGEPTRRDFITRFGQMTGMLAADRRPARAR